MHTDDTDKDTELNRNEEKKRKPFVKLCGLRTETPEFRRCCFCIPLRRGLIGCGYVKLALCMWEIGLMAYFVLHYPELEAVMLLEIIHLLADAPFTGLLIVGGHLKKVKFLKIVYIYNIVWLVLALLGLGWLIYGDLRLAGRYITEHEHYSHILPLLIVGFCVQCSIFFLQMYWILLIRSLIAKLRDQPVEILFTNTSTAEAQCTLHKHNPLAAEAQCTLHNPSVILTDVEDRPHAKPDTSVDCTSL